jgi:hypothetical protein
VSASHDCGLVGGAVGRALRKRHPLTEPRSDCPANLPRPHLLVSGYRQVSSQVASEVSLATPRTASAAPVPNPGRRPSVS